ncbi:hypothetical protein, partial [Streptomyces sp. NPDC000405]|uniref:hypothetical protein n=1 Tax=Streptomyces sp. NPDC000405 TaxID=3161033 RepID=UPI00398CA73A
TADVDVGGGVEVRQPVADAEEVRGYAEGIVAKYGANPEELAEAFDELRDVAADREACEQAIADATAPKDPAPVPQSENSPSPSAG